MFSSLRNTLEDFHDSFNNGSLCYITETLETSANFLIIYHLVEALKGDQTVCFIALQNTWSHYCIIGTKLGINLKKRVNDGNILLLDGNKELMKRIFDEVSDENLFSHLDNAMDCLKKIYNFVKNKTEILNNDNKKYSVIIDSLMPFVNMKFSVYDIDTFVQNCQHLIEGYGHLVLSSAIDDRDKSLILLSRLMLRKCNINLSVKGLSTGISGNVHGKLSVTVLLKKAPMLSLKEASYHYKVEERDIKLFELSS